MRRNVLFLGLVILSTVPVSAQMGRQLTLEDYYSVKSVGSPLISPAGDWITFTVSQRIEETNGTTTESWVVRSDGLGRPVRVQHNGQDVSNPRWTDDGHLRFSHQDRIWLIDPARLSGPAARDESVESSGVASPDGQWTAFTQDMPQPERPELDLSAFERRHEERFKGEAFDWYPFRRDGQRFPLPDARERALTEIFIAATDGSGESRQLTRLRLRPGNVRWRPNSSELLFTADEAVLDELAYSRSDLFVVTVEGELTRLTNDGYTYSGADFSPDGRWISYTRAFGTNMIIDRKLNHGGPRDLYVRPTDGGEPLNLTENWDLDPGSPMWSPDSQHIYFVAGIGGARHLFRAAPDGGGVEQITTGHRRINGLDINESFQRMTYTVGEFERPSDIYVADIDGGNEYRLTNIHADFFAEVEVASRPSEQILYTSYDGTPVEGFLLYPFGYDPQGQYPLIVVNHGGPHSASGYGFNFKNMLFAANGYFVFLPNFRSSTGYGDTFKWGTWGAWGTNDGEDVLAGVDHLIARYSIDRNRVGSTGHSYGGILTNWLITRYPDRFKAAVSGAGASNWTSNYALSDVARTKELEFLGPPWDPEAREVMIKQSAYLNSAGVQAATLFVHGEEDYRVPLEGSIQLYTSLKKQRVPTKLIIYEGMPHGIRGHWNNVHRMANELRWWETYLKPAGAVPVSDESNH
ncbi:MAG: S9 family peptidase [Gemmatimonadetes bacterium]|nr:S9 family peptidase [Gemmatimonadota bacterium]